MFHNFNILQSARVQGIISAFSGTFNALSSEKRLLNFRAFPALIVNTHYRQSFVLTVQFFPPAWSIEISCVQAIYKEYASPRAQGKRY